MAFGWVGELTRLAPLDKSKHLANAITWLNDPVVTEWIAQGDFPLTRLAEEEFFDTVAKETDTAAHFAIETAEGIHLGFTGVIHIDWRHRFAVTGSFIGRTDFWGKGYGSDAAIVRTRYAFEVLGLRVLLSEAMAGNGRSIGMLEKSGYREVGRIPGRYWKRGDYRDLVQMVVTLDEWRAKAGVRDGEEAPSKPRAEAPAEPGDGEEAPSKPRAEAPAEPGDGEEAPSKPRAEAPAEPQDEDAAAPERRDEDVSE